jgi:hypothetical protein
MRGIAFHSVVGTLSVQHGARTKPLGSPQNYAADSQPGSEIGASGRMVGKPYLGITSGLPVIRPRSAIDLACDLWNGDPVQIALGRVARERIDTRQRTRYRPQGIDPTCARQADDFLLGRKSGRRDWR